MRPRRSFLYTPADDIEMMSTALESGADAVIFDLEDAVPSESLADARENVVEIADDVPEADVERCVRINGLGTDDWLDDLLAVGAAVDTVVLPMIESPEAVETAARVASRVTDPGPELIVTVETPGGVFTAPEIADRCREHPRVTGFSFGFADYVRAVGATGRPQSVRTFVANVVVAAAALGGMDALYTVYQAHEDLDGLRETAESAREMGFVGLKAVHPRQVPVINEVFTPSEEAVERARTFVETYDAAERDSIAVDGTFLDAAIVDQYRTVLARHRAIEGDDS